jgi:macrolide-specific efflux system membrane fusion protein
MNVHDKIGAAMRPTATSEHPGFVARARNLGSRAVRAVRRRPILAGAILVALIAVVAYSFSGGEEQAPEQILVEAERGDVENVITAVGNLQPRVFVDVGAQVSGQLEILHVEAGNEVQKGQLLAEIDATVQMSRVESDRAQLQNQRAQLADRQAQLQLAKAQADRQERLWAERATSQEAYDSAKAQLVSAEAQVRSTMAQIQQSESVLKGNEATLGYSKIYAPIAGTVSSITAKQGQTLNANQSAPTVLQIADLSTMTVSAQVSEADVPNLYAGMDAYFTTLGNPGQRWSGKLRQIMPTPQVVNNVVMYTALFDVENPGRELMTQMTAQVFFVLTAAYDVVTVPVSAVRYTDRGQRGGGAGGGAARPDQNRGNQGGEVVARNEAGDQAGGRRGGGDQAAQRGGGDQAALREGGDQAAQRGGGQRAEGRGSGVAVPRRERPGLIRVVLEDGSQEDREVVLGVTDRINVEVVSGVAAGEMVVAGELVDNREDDDDDDRDRRGGFGGFGGRGGFGGAP